MGFLKQMKDLKNTVHEAPGMVAQARELGAQAQAYAAASGPTPRSWRRRTPVPRSTSNR